MPQESLEPPQSSRFGWCNCNCLGPLLGNRGMRVWSLTMITERLVEVLSDSLSRRRFLARICGGLVASVAATMGGTPNAVAASEGCCGLCLGNDGQCLGCHCVWCWTCPVGDLTWRCCECYDSTGDCGGGCSGVFCSWAERISPECPQLPAA